MANKTSKSNESYFSRYKTAGLYAAHRKAKLERLAKLQPNNLQIPLAIKSLTSYRRGTPKVPTWSHQEIAIAGLYKRFVGKFDKHMFSAKPDEADAARKVRNPNLFSETNPQYSKDWASYPKKKVSEFSIAARAHDGQGNLVWA